MGFTRRELRGTVLALDYAKNYNHGASGHGGYGLEAKLARTSCSKIVIELVRVFDEGVYHDSLDIVARAIEAAPEEFIMEEKR